MSYVRPATYAGLLYPTDYKTQIQRCIIQTKLRRQKAVRLIFAPYSSFKEALAVFCEAYAVVDTSFYTRVIILASLDRKRTVQTPFSRFALPDRRCEIVDVNHAQGIGYASEIDCINCPQAELQLLFLSCVFNLQKTEVYVIYAGDSLETQQLQYLLTDSTLVVAAVEFCRVGAGFGFLPKCSAGLRDYVTKANEALVDALQEGTSALADALRAVSMDSTSAMLCAVRLFRPFKPLSLKILRQGLSATLESRLDSAKSFCAVAGYTGEIKTWNDDSVEEEQASRH